jgi:hypothetical protein
MYFVGLDNAGFIYLHQEDYFSVGDLSGSSLQWVARAV